MDATSDASDRDSQSVEVTQEECEDAGEKFLDAVNPSTDEVDAEAEPSAMSSLAKLDHSSCVRAMSQCSRVLNHHYGREILEAASMLQSLCNVQDTSLDIIENRHREIIDIRETYQLEEIIDEAQSYYNKLLRLKKEMAALSLKSKELTKRASYVKEVRAKEKAKRDEERRRVEQMERDLAPRYATGLTN